MKIYLLKVSPCAQPKKQCIVYPRHNEDFGVEQDFIEFLYNKNYLTLNPAEADWHYLPVFWTRWHLNHDYGKTGRNELQRIIDDAILDDARTFTICQYDDGPLVELGRTVQFLASRKTEYGKDVPLLCKQHRKPWFIPKKKYLASFIGRLDTHPVRVAMHSILQSRTNISIFDGNMGTARFVKQVLQSHLALAPRGYGGSSFRFFEAMQLGVTPILIGDIDTRPFKRHLPFNEASFYVQDEIELIGLLDRIPVHELKEMGERAAQLYRDHLTYQKWCPYVLKELQNY